MKKKGRSKGKNPKLQAVVYEINGQIGGVKRNGQWMVTTPHGNVTFELAEEVAISVNLADYSYAKPGDTSSCAGLQNGERTATGESLEVSIKGRSVTFGPSTQGPAITLQNRFGRPQKSSAKGTVTAADGTVGSPGRWQIWTWGPVKVAVDNRRKTRFFSYQPDEQ